MKIQPGVLKKPAFKIGHEQGTLRVVAYLGHGSTRPDNGKHLEQSMHWYKVRCSCGNKEVVNQGNLRGGKQTCKECNKRLRSEAKKGKPIDTHYAWTGRKGHKQRKQNKTEMPSDVLSALKGKW